ncbi:hypothetical protein NJ7G_3039 [Natrinema sp. J7-2]|nr:hypothetical protein NJ7G_3039 [Natrinema sp. J7-2]
MKEFQKALSIDADASAQAIRSCAIHTGTPRRTETRSNGVYRTRVSRC